MTPPALERLVRSCMAKEREDRIQSAHDVKLQLDWIAEAGSQAGIPAPVVTRRGMPKKMGSIGADKATRRDSRAAIEPGNADRGTSSDDPGTRDGASGGDGRLGPFPIAIRYRSVGDCILTPGPEAYCI